MPTLNVASLLIAVAFTLVMAVFGSLLAGNHLSWFANLQQPRVHIPFWAFVGVGAIVYILDVIIAYRLLTEVTEQTGRIIALTALAVVMLYNELYNYVFMGWRNTFAGFLATLAFLAPLVILQVTLFLVDRTSALLLLVYMLWVIAYDIPWSYSLWKLNPQERGEARKEGIQLEKGEQESSGS